MGRLASPRQKAERIRPVATAARRNPLVYSGCLSASSVSVVGSATHCAVLAAETVASSAEAGV